MPLKKSTGNMYPWVTHTHSHLAGECPHKCSYCYVGRNRFGRPARYTGPVRLVEEEFLVKYGAGKTIFVDHCGDLWAKDISVEFAPRVLEHCRQWPDNVYVFQTKNPARYAQLYQWLPARSILGCTVESNREYRPIMGSAPTPMERISYMGGWLRESIHPRFLTIEPILDFDLPSLLGMVVHARPNFVNIGADSKGCGLPEPSAEKVRALIEGIQDSGIEIREKHNLARLMK